MKQLLLCAGIAALSLAATAQTPGWVGLQDAPHAISPNGKYIVGDNFLYDTERGRYDTPSDDAFFWAVNDSGNAAGAILDTSVQTKDNDESGVTGYARRATLWIDGEEVDLGYGDVANPAETFVNSVANGSYAMSISDDNKIVYGVIFDGTTNCSTACAWVLDDATGKYQYRRLKTILDANYFECGLHASADGKLMLIEAKLFGSVNNREYLLYTSPDATPIHFKPEGCSNIGLIAISPDGYFLSFSASYNGVESLCVYDVMNDEVICVMPKTEGVNSFLAGGSLSNDLEGFVTVDDGSGYMSRSETLYYYNVNTLTLMPAKDYFGLFVTDIPGVPSSLAYAYAVGGSGDGKKVAGITVTDNYAESSVKGWYFELPDERPVIVNAPKNVSMAFSSPTSVKLFWNAPDVLPAESTLTGFSIIIDSTETDLALADLRQTADGRYVFEQKVNGGTHSGRVATVIEKEGKKFVSADAAASVSMTTNTDLYFFDNFDDCESSGANVFYNGHDWFPIMSPVDDVMLWHLDFNNFTNNTPFFSTQVLQPMMPYESVLNSRFLDATGQDNFYLTFYLFKKGISINGEPAASDRQDDFFAVQYSLNGEDWTTLWETSAAEYQKGRWNFFQVDLSDLKDKTFQLRFNAYGAGQGAMQWHIDYMGVMPQGEPTPVTGLRSLSSQGKVDLEWHNPAGAYEVSYLEDSPVLTSDQQCVGSEGLPLTVAIDLPADKLRNYVGKYITDVTTLIFDDMSIQDQQTTTEAIIYENGTEVARSQFGPWTYTDTDWHSQISSLQNPLQIKPNTDYRVGIRISNYAETAHPLWYQSSADFIPGVTDLFSEDDGQTWLLFSDTKDSIEDEDKWNKFARAVWPIRVFIHDNPADSQTYDNALLGYNVFRNGQRINAHTVYYPHPRYTDAAPLVGESAEYTVQAYYTDGRRSDISAPLVVTAAGLTDLAQPDNRISVWPNPATDLVNIDGQFLSARLFTLSGTCLLETSASQINVAGLDPGLYLLQIDLGATLEIVKIIVR